MALFNVEWPKRMDQSVFTDQLKEILQQTELEEDFIKLGDRYCSASEELRSEFARRPREAFYQLANLYAQANDNQREAIRKQWDYGRHWAVPDQETLACTVPTDKSSAERIRASLIWLSIIADHEDYRDTLVSLCRIYHSARLAGLDSDSLVSQVADLSSAQTAKLFREFVRRDEYMKSFKVFYLKEVPSANGIRIEYEGWPSISVKNQRGDLQYEVSSEAPEPFDLEPYLEKGRQATISRKPWWKFW